MSCSTIFYPVHVYLVLHCPVLPYSFIGRSFILFWPVQVDFVMLSLCSCILVPYPDHGHINALADQSVIIYECDKKMSTFPQWIEQKLTIS